MADINYKSTHGKDNWVSQTEFDGLDLSAQEEGTVYEIVGEVGESDLDADLQAKIDTKMDAPTTSGTSGQVLTMGTDGKAKWATAESGAKYLHYVNFTVNTNEHLYFWVFSTSSTAITSIQELHNAIVKNKKGKLRSFYYPLFSPSFGNQFIIAIRIFSSSSANLLEVHFLGDDNPTIYGTNGIAVDSVTDTVITL